jgi:hypothetical protein
MSIQKRTIFVDTFTDGVIRFGDWALVTTTLGTMAEPFMPNDRHTIDYDTPDFDATDECVRIDEIRNIPLDNQQQALSGGDFALNGGTQNPRAGR